MSLFQRGHSEWGAKELAGLVMVQVRAHSVFCEREKTSTTQLRTAPNDRQEFTTFPKHDPPARPLCVGADPSFIVTQCMRSVAAPVKCALSRP